MSREFTIDGKTYPLVDKGHTFAEAAAMERVTGLTFQAISSDPAVQGSIGVVQAMLWVSIKRVEPETPFSKLNDLAVDAIEWSDDDEEESEPGEDPTPPGEADEPSNS